MDAEVSSVTKRKAPGFMTLLSSAACEWFLMFLLFVDAALSYFLTKFAHYCELKTPCLLCSRLDNGFGEKKPGFYWSLLCSNHKEEISSVVSCSIHGKFADVHGMCDECLRSIAMQKSSNSEPCRLLVGKSWTDVDRSVLQNAMLKKHIRLGSPDCRTCSCCSKTWRKVNAEKLLELKPVGFGASKANLKPPLPRAPGRSRFSRRDSLKRLRDKFSGPMTHHPAGSNSVDTLSHVGYTKLKISSDSESEFPFSEDDDDGNTRSHCKDCGRTEYDVHSDKRGLHFKPPDDNAASEKQTDERSEVKPSILDQPNLLDLSEHKNVDSSTSDDFIKHGPEDHGREESYNKPSPSLILELISLDDGPQSPDVAGAGPFGASAETTKPDVMIPNMQAISVLSELLLLCNVPPTSNTVTIPKKTNIEGTSGKGYTSVAKHIEDVAGTADDAHSLESNSMNQTDASTQSDESRELPDRRAVEEPVNSGDSAKTEEDVKSLPQVSTSEVGLLSKDTSPRANDKREESKMDEDSSLQVLPNSASLKKNDSSSEPLDGIIEGESIVEQLKCQIEQDRNCMNSLYKELEEERNAAAVAANQAMAMITRLQEEKAALHMEALQYLRMMEEQAEYDMEALERANDLLAEKEKELQDMEIELEFYRNYLDESGVQNKQKETSTENGPSTSSNSTAAKVSKANGNCKPMNSIGSNFEDERLYISQCLKKLEKKLHQAYFRGKLDDMPNGDASDLQDLPPNSETLLNQENEENRSLVQRIISVPNGNSAHDEENGGFYEKSDKFSANGGEINFATFEKEIAELHERLEALETDRNFLKLTSDLLRNGKEGSQMVQEIAHQLQELRKTELQKR